MILKKRIIGSNYHNLEEVWTWGVKTPYGYIVNMNFKDILEEGFINNKDGYKYIVTSFGKKREYYFFNNYYIAKFYDKNNKLKEEYIFFIIRHKEKGKGKELITHLNPNEVIEYYNLNWYEKNGFDLITDLKKLVGLISDNKIEKIKDVKKIIEKGYS